MLEAQKKQMSLYVRFKKSMIKTLARLTLEREFNKLIKNIPPRLNVLDIGAKDAPYKKTINSKTYTTLDIDQESNPDICCDAHNIPRKDEIFDLVIATEFLEHCYDPQKAIDEIYRVLRKEGICILSTRFIKEIHGEPNDYFRFTYFGLKHLFKKFNYVKIVPLGNAFSSIMDLTSYHFPPIRLFNRLLLNLIKISKTKSPNGYLVFAIKS